MTTDSLIAKIEDCDHIWEKDESGIEHAWFKATELLQIIRTHEALQKQQPKEDDVDLMLKINQVFFKYARHLNECPADKSMIIPRPVCICGCDEAIDELNSSTVKQPKPDMGASVFLASGATSPGSATRKDAGSEAPTTTSDMYTETPLAIHDDGNCIKTSAISVDGLTFNQQDVDNLVAIYNHESCPDDPLKESLFRAIKVCQQALCTTKPACPYIVTSPATVEDDGGTSYCSLAATREPVAVSLEKCVISLKEADNNFDNGSPFVMSCEQATCLTKAVLNAAGVSYVE